MAAIRFPFLHPRARPAARHGRRDNRGAERVHRLAHLAPHGGGVHSPEPDGTLSPPEPPVALNPAVACDPQTDDDVLWFIARNVPELRRWLVANPAADARLLEYVAQTSGPGVNEALTILLESLEPRHPTPNGETATT